MALHLIFFNLNLALCRHLLMISERLLRVLAQSFLNYSIYQTAVPRKSLKAQLIALGK